MNFYKYLHPSRINILSNQQIRFTQATHLNDGFEALPNFTQFSSSHGIEKYLSELDLDSLSDEEVMRLAEEAMQSLISSPDSETYKIFLQELRGYPPRKFAEIVIEMAKTFFKAFLAETLPPNSGNEKFKASLDKQIGILSLTCKNNNTLMWSHYADSEKGFVIQLNPSDKLFENGKSELKSLQVLNRVKYSNKRPNVNIFDFGIMGPKMIEKTISSILLTKSKAWSYEEELRMIRPLIQAEEKKYIDSQDIYLFSFDSIAVMNVFIGSRAEQSLEFEIKKILREPRYTHVGLYKASQDHSEYKFQFSEIQR